ARHGRQGGARESREVDRRRRARGAERGLLVRRPQQREDARRRSRARERERRRGCARPPDRRVGRPDPRHDDLRAPAGRWRARSRRHLLRRRAGRRAAARGLSGTFFRRPVYQGRRPKEGPMLRLSFCWAVAVLAIAPSAFAAGPSPGLSQDASQGVQLPEGDVSYATEPDGSGTKLIAVRPADGRVLRQLTLAASWGIPVAAFDGTTGGLSADGRTLVLGDASPYSGPLRTSSRFLIVDPRTLRPRSLVRLRGDFGYDALSPDGTRLYLVNHVSTADAFRYVVRAYDLAHHRLL